MLACRNSAHRYGWLAMLLHWLMAIVVLVLFGLGVYMTGLDYTDVWYHRAPMLHKGLGVLFLFLLCFRLLWRVANPLPVLLGQVWEKFVALTVHRMHYALMLVLGLSGYLIPTSKGMGIDVFDWFVLPAFVQLNDVPMIWVGNMHWIAAWAMLTLVILHVGAACKHHWIDQDATLLRMLGQEKNKKGK